MREDDQEFNEEMSFICGDTDELIYMLESKRLELLEQNDKLENLLYIEDGEISKMKRQNGKVGKIVSIDDWSFERFKELLIEAEGCGTVAVRTIAEAGIERWRDDCERLIQLAELARLQACLANFRGDSDLTGTWLQLDIQICDCAKENLPAEDYHRFCEKVEPYINTSSEVLLDMLRFLC